MSKTAHILAIKVDSIAGELGFGISNHPGDIATILEGEVWAGPRPTLEEDEDFVQPIPYVVLRKGDEVLTYRRGGSGGEGRLHGKYSIGLGGHIDATDAIVDEHGAISLSRSIAVAAIRELEEELGIDLSAVRDDSNVLRFTHVISSHATPVDCVHVGFVAVVDYGTLAAADVDTLAIEDCVENATWRKPWTLLAEKSAGEIELEGWTERVLTALVETEKA